MAPCQGHLTPRYRLPILAIWKQEAFLDSPEGHRCPVTIPPTATWGIPLRHLIGGTISPSKGMPMSSQKPMKSYMKNSIKGGRRRSHWKEGVAHAHHDASVREGGETPAMITPPVVERALPKGIALKESKIGPLPYLKSPLPMMYSSKANWIRSWVWGETNKFLPRGNSGQLECQVKGRQISF